MQKFELSPNRPTNFDDMQPLPSWRQHIARDSRVMKREHKIEG